MTWRVWACVGFVALGALLLGLDLADGRLDEGYPGFVGSIVGAWVPVIVIVLFVGLGVREYGRAQRGASRGHVVN